MACTMLYQFHVLLRGPHTMLRREARLYKLVEVQCIFLDDSLAGNQVLNWWGDDTSSTGPCFPVSLSSTDQTSHLASGLLSLVVGNGDNLHDAKTETHSLSCYIMQLKVIHSSKRTMWGSFAESGGIDGKAVFCDFPELGPSAAPLFRFLGGMPHQKFAAWPWDSETGFSMHKLKAKLTIAFDKLISLDISAYKPSKNLQPSRLF